MTPEAETAARLTEIEARMALAAESAGRAMADVRLIAVSKTFGAPEILPVLAASRVRYARKHRGRASAWAEQAAIALGELTHTLVGRGGRAARAGHLRALRTAAGSHPHEI